MPATNLLASSSQVADEAAERSAPLRALHVAAEVFPLVKTGGLADVAAALPPALARQGADVRLLLPGYPAVMEAVQRLRPVVDFGPMFGALRVRLMTARMPGTALPVYLVDAPWFFRRPGGPYQDRQGQEWPDNAARFALLGWAAAHLAAGDADLQWTPDVVHAHDWHAGLACAYMATHPALAAASVFTVHNLAYQGLFPLSDAAVLGLPGHLASPAGVEFHGQLSFMKAGLQFADHVTTVSPRYAQEIATHDFGCGLEGVIRARGPAVTGILNGIDDEAWNPATDPAIAVRFDAERLQGKRACRLALQDELGLQRDDAAPLMVVVSRLTSQKGLDLVLSALPELLAHGVQLAVQGAGEPALEAAFRMAEQAHPGRVAVRLGYDEARAHRLIAGADAILVPSRFEPCGLTQMYGLRYGTLPIVRRVGGLADTVVDAAVPGQGTGFVFDAATPAALAEAVGRAAAALRTPLWRELLVRAMACRFDWSAPAVDYLALYRMCVQARAAALGAR